MIKNEGLLEEFKYVTVPDEQEHIEGLFASGDELMQDIAYNLISGNNTEVGVLVKKALDEGYSANIVLDDGLIAGMAIVGIKFRDNVIFVPEVLISARAMKAGMEHIEPILSASGVEPIGTVIMGTVKGDLHDIGKNLCIMMLRGGGFLVHDLGVDTKPDDFIDAVMEHEAAIVGISAGYSIMGGRTIVELMFGDFSTLVFDQILQHVTKFELMYNGQISCPLIIRMPMGGKRGYGPTHSQSLEKHFMGIPNLMVIALHHRIAPSFVFDSIKQNNVPVLLIENKILN